MVGFCRRNGNGIQEGNKQSYPQMWLFQRKHITDPVLYDSAILFILERIISSSTLMWSSFLLRVKHKSVSIHGSTSRMTTSFACKMLELFQQTMGRSVSTVAASRHRRRCQDDFSRMPSTVLLLSTFWLSSAQLSRRRCCFSVFLQLLFAKRFAISQHCFHRHRYCFDLSNALWCVGYAVAVTKESYHVSCRLDSRDRYTVLNLGCSIILFPLSPTSFYFAHFVLELILVYIASQLKYRLVG